MNLRGRKVSLIAGLGGIAVLLLLLVLLACRNRILEEWYLYRLEADDPGAREHAASGLEKLGSKRPGYFLYRLKNGHASYFSRCVDTLGDAGQEFVDLSSRSCGTKASMRRFAAAQPRPWEE